MNTIEDVYDVSRVYLDECHGNAQEIAAGCMDIADGIGLEPTARRRLADKLESWARCKRPTLDLLTDWLTDWRIDSIVDG